MEAFYLCNSEIFGLSNSTAVVYNFLCKVNNVSSGKSFYSKESIAKACGISKSTVLRDIRELCKKGLLKIRSRFDNGRQTSNDYILIESPQMELSEVNTQDSAPQVKQEAKISESLTQPRLFSCNSVAAGAGLSPKEVKVYSYLSFRAGKDGKCMPSKKEIAADCRMSVATVGRAIKALCRKDLIAVLPQTRMEKFGNNGTSVNQYMLLKVQRPDISTETPLELSESCTAEATDNSPAISSEAVNGPVTIAEKAPAVLSEPEARTTSIPSIECPDVPSPQAPYQTGFFDQFRDTLPSISRDTPRTTPKKKATFNLRKKRLFSRLAKWYKRIFERKECRNK